MTFTAVTSLYRHMLEVYFRSNRPNNIVHMLHALCSMIIFSESEVGQLPDLKRFYCWHVASCCDLDFWPFDLERL